jgi:small subunit ribosomal protein S5
MAREQSEFEERVIQVDRISRVVKGGKRMRFRALVTVGNGKGQVGLGLGKALEVASAVQKAVSDAKKNLITLPIVNGSIPHEQKYRFGTSQVLLKPAAMGTGIIAGGAARAVIEVSGIKNILSKTYGSNNRMNVALATYFALASLIQKEDRLRELGKFSEAKVKEKKAGEELPREKKKSLTKKK